MLRAPAAKLIFLFLFLLGSWSVKSALPSVAVGDSKESVYAALGEPAGYLSYNDTELLLYDRGVVELRDGRVVTEDVLSEEEWQAQRARRAREEERRRARERARMRQRYLEGVALRDRYLQDESLQNAPPARQVEFWQSFRERYPNVELPEQYAKALEAMEARLTLEAEIAERESRIAELEARLREAEERARQAEASASHARSSHDTDSVYLGSTFGGHHTWLGSHGGSRHPRRSVSFAGTLHHGGKFHHSGRAASRRHRIHSTHRPHRFHHSPHTVKPHHGVHLSTHHAHRPHHGHPGQVSGLRSIKNPGIGFVGQRSRASTGVSRGRLRF